MNQPKRIILTGGGSGGPVFPLLAVADEIKRVQPDVDFLFVGTKNGPEKKLVEDSGIKFVGIPAAKFRRYFSISNFTDGFVFVYSLFAARKVLKKYQPDLVCGAGGFVAVPVSWIAWLMKVKVVMHQQDARVGLANKLITPFAAQITTAFEKTSKDFYSGSGISSAPLRPSAEWVGNPVRPEFFRPASTVARQKFGLNDSLPVLLIMGGATGANQINEVALACMPELTKTHQVLHITGPGKNTAQDQDANYHPLEFTPHIRDALDFADIVIARAGLSTLAELSVLGKIAVIIPMPGTHQEENGKVLQEKGAALVLSREEFNPQDLPRIVTSLKFNVDRQKLLRENMKNLMPHDAATRIAQLILKHVN